MAGRKDFHLVGKDERKSNITRQIVKHRMGVAIRYIVAIVAVVLLIALLIMQYKNQIYTGISITHATDKQSLEANSYLNNDGSVITYSKDGISTTDASGNVLWNMTYEMQNPLVHTNKGIVAVCDYNGHIIHVINGSGKTTEIDTNLPIRDFCVSSNGLVATILEENKSSWVNLYDENGALLVEIKATMSKTGYPLAITLSGEVMGVAYFYVDGQTMKSSVTFYNFGGIGENAADHIVSSYDYTDAVVPIIDFIDSETVFAVADNRLMFYQGAKKPVSTSDSLVSENIVGVYHGYGNVGLVYYDSTGEHKYRLDMYNTNGRVDYSYFYDIDFKDIIISNKQAMIYNDQECIVLNDRGRVKFEGQFPENVIYVSNTESNKKYIAVTSERIETFTFE